MAKANVAYDVASCDSTVKLDDQEYPVPATVKAAHLKNASKFARNGSKVWIALALYFTAKGATSAQVEQLCGQAQLNKLRALSHGGKVDMITTHGKDPVTGKSGMTFYKARIKKGKKAAKAQKAA